MAKKRKKKVSATTVEAKGVVFGVLVHDETATIVAEQGVVMLQSDTTKQIYNMPAGVPVNADMYGQQCDITVRDMTGEVILERGEDDIYEEDLQKDERLMAVESTSDLEEIYNETKIRLFTKLAGLVGTFVGGIGLAGFCYWLSLREFPYPVLLYALIPVGAVLGVACGLVPCVSTLRKLSSNIVSDEAGNYVNMKTGRSNLNGGMTLPVREG